MRIALFWVFAGAKPFQLAAHERSRNTLDEGEPSGHGWKPASLAQTSSTS